MVETVVHSTVKDEPELCEAKEPRAGVTMTTAVTMATESPLCVACRQPIMESHLMKVNGVFWHEQCLRYELLLTRVTIGVARCY